MIIETYETNGMLVKKIQTYVEDSIIGESATKKEAVESIIIETNGIEYDGKTKSRADLCNVTALANYEFIKAMCVAMPELQPIYDAIYLQNINWRCADNLIHSVSFEDIAITANKAMKAYASTIGV